MPPMPSIRVQTIEDGLAAVELHKYGALLLDLSVGGESELDALRRIRARGNEYAFRS